MDSNVNFNSIWAENTYISDNDNGATTNAPDSERQWVLESRRFTSNSVTTVQQWYRSATGLYLRHGSDVDGVVFTAWTSWVKIADYSGAGVVTSVNGETGDVVVSLDVVGS